MTAEEINSLIQAMIENNKKHGLHSPYVLCSKIAIDISPFPEITNFVRSDLVPDNALYLGERKTCLPTFEELLKKWKL